MEHEVLENEQHLTQATRSLDIDALDRIYAEDIMFTGVTGATCNKSALMDEARRGLAQREAAGTARQSVTAYEKDDLKFVAHGDTAVTTYRFAVRIQLEDKEINRRYRTTNVWMKRQGRWQVIAAHTASLE
jgi:ketosteroid isomerase-like protein